MSETDIRYIHDFLIPHPKLDIEGVRVVVL